MYIGFKHLHSFLAYPLLIALVITLLIAFYAFITKAPYTKTHRISALVGLISAHLQLIFGLILYFISPLGLSNFSGEKMGDSISRLYFLEHPIMMILAIAFVTIGFSKAKRAKNDQSKHKAVMIFYGLGLILVLSRIPWQAWPQF
jgi:uncharacterized membrane protein